MRRLFGEDLAEPYKVKISSDPHASSKRFQMVYLATKLGCPKELEINEIFYKTMRPDLKGKVEIIPAKNIEDVRNQLHSRGRENYLITGDTYQNKGKIRNIARVKFDYELKGYRGEFSPKELEELRKLLGIEIEKIQPTTKEDIEASKTAKAHSKAKKYIRHKRVKGSIWQKDNPFTDEQNQENYSLTWLFSSGDSNRLNTNFQNYVKNKEDSIKRRLKLNNIEDAPEDVLDAIDRYRKEVYNKILADLRGKQVAPSMVITGSSNYKGNFDKRESIERNAYERYKKVDNAVDRVVGQYVNLKKTKTAEERRQEYREKITPKLIEAKAKGKKAFFDAEYDPSGTKNGPYGIFLLGWMDRNGNVKQLFLDNSKDELKMLKDFNQWVEKEKPLFIAYGSRSADVPHLRSSCARFKLSSKHLENSFFDLYYDLLYTSNQRKQKYFLPVAGSFGLKRVSESLGYQRSDLIVSSGFDALTKYEKFLRSKRGKTKEKIKNDLLIYNKDDLKRTKFIYDFLKAKL